MKRGPWAHWPSYRQQLVLSLALTVAVVAINGFLIANLLDLIRVFVALASLILIVLATGYLTLGARAIPPPEDETRSLPSGPSPSATVGALITMNVLFVLAAALAATTSAVGERPGRDVLVHTPTAGQIVYRVWGDGPGDCPPSERFGRSWTPVDPRSYGPDAYRLVAGLPDECNGGQHLTWGRLDSATNASVTWAVAVSVSPTSAFCHYPGGLVEYVIDDPQVHVVPLGAVELDPDYGGNPGPCP